MNIHPRRWRVFALCLLFVSTFATPVHAGVTPWMDLKVVDGDLMIPTEVAGIPGQSIIDTGATVTAINGRFVEAEQLDFDTGRKVTIKGVFGEEKRTTYRKVPGAIFGAPVTFLNVVDVDFGGPDVQLLLGANFFENYIFQFDYTNQRMRLITRDTVDMKAISNVDAKKDRDGGSLVIRVTLNDDDNAWLLMDTGSNGGLLIERDFAKRLDWIGTYPTLDGTATGVISGGEMEYFRIPSLEVGPFKIENALVSMPTEGQNLKFFETVTPVGSRLARRNAAQGILGYDVLKHFVVTIDYDKGYVHFYPGEKEPAD